MKLRHLAPALVAVSLAGVASAQFQTSVNSVVVRERVFNDFPNSTLTTVDTYPSQVSFTDTLTPNAAGGGFANRHVFDFSADNTNAYRLTGPNDFFNVAFDLVLTTGGAGRKEAGFILTTNENAAGGTAPRLEQFYIVNSDAGEVVSFGDPLPFALFGKNSDGNGYAPGSTIRMGYRYFRDTDNLYKVTLSASGYQSRTLQLTNFNGYDFGTVGLPAGTLLSGYAQFTGSGQTSSATFSNFTPNPVPEPATLAALGLGAAALLRRRRKG